MKKILLLLAALLPLSLPLTGHAGVSIGVNVPGLSLHIGDRDSRGYYWDGGYWREPRWWYEHHRPRYYYAPPPRVYYAPPPRPWHGRPGYHHGYDRHHHDHHDHHDRPRWHH